MNCLCLLAQRSVIKPNKCIKAEFSHLSSLARCNSDHTLWPCGLSCISGDICSWSSFDRQSVSDKIQPPQVHLLHPVYQILKYHRALYFIFEHDSLSRSHGSGVCEEWGWNLRCSSYTSPLLRLEQVWELSLLETGADDLLPAMHTCFIML